MSLETLSEASMPLRPTLQQRNLPNTIGGNFGRWLRAVRLKHGITLGAIAYASKGKLTVSGLRTLEVRGSAPRLDTFFWICIALEISPAQALKQIYTGSLHEQVAKKYSGI